MNLSDWLHLKTQLENQQESEGQITQPLKIAWIAKHNCGLDHNLSFAFAFTELNMFSLLKTPVVVYFCQKDSTGFNVADEYSALALRNSASNRLFCAVNSVEA